MPHEHELRHAEVMVWADTKPEAPGQAIKDGPHGSLDAAAGVRACENGGLQEGGRCQVSR